MAKPLLGIVGFICYLLYSQDTFTSPKLNTERCSRTNGNKFETKRLKNRSMGDRIPDILYSTLISVMTSYEAILFPQEENELSEFGFKKKNIFKNATNRWTRYMCAMDPCSMQKQTFDYKPCPKQA